MTRSLRWIVLVAALVYGLGHAPVRAESAAVEIALTALPGSGQPAGTPVLWTAQVSGTGFAPLRYRFAVQSGELERRIVRDFSPENYLRWTPLAEGLYEIEVTVMNATTGGTWTASETFTVRSRVRGTDPVVSTTSHPLVLLYSAPACEEGEIRVRFKPEVGGDWTYTPWETCRSNQSYNVYLGGMRARTNYTIEHEWKVGEQVSIGPTLTQRTGALEMEMPRFIPWNPADLFTSRAEGVVLHSINGGKVYERVFPVATDLAGQVIWYYRFREFDSPTFPWHAGSYLVRPVPGGTFLLFLNARGEFDAVFREVDLAGQPLRETNVQQVNRQLTQRGEDTIGYFHHEALRLSNGHTLVLGSVERILTDVQGEGEVNILGDMILELDRDFQVVWTWNPFDHLDVTRKAVLDEVCTIVTVGCPPISKSARANDWTHSNSLAYSPADGNLLLSLRNQDWIIKLDYMNGAGSGKVLWRLGKDGDFTLESDDPYPWFSHQHDVVLAGNEVVVFDNGNTRCVDGGADCHSRGQVYELDNTTMTATLRVNADLGSYSTAFGSAQRLSNGNYHFLSGIVLPRVVSQSVEVDAKGRQIYLLETEGSQYRSYRLADLYSSTPVVVVPAQIPQVYLPLLR